MPAVRTPAWIVGWWLLLLLGDFGEALPAAFFVVKDGTPCGRDGFNRLARDSRHGLCLRLSFDKGLLLVFRDFAWAWLLQMCDGG